jgi:hypothetical protein
MRRFLIWSAAVMLALTAMLGGAPVAFAEETQCRGTIGAVTLDNIFVPDGKTCVLKGTRAKGTVKVGTGATLDAIGVRVNGNIQAEGAASVTVRGGSIVGGNIQIVQGGRATIDRARIDGDLLFDENRAAIRATSNVIGGNLQSFKNTGGVYIAKNRIAENLQCKENRPAPTGGGNSAGSKEDQCERL